MWLNQVFSLIQPIEGINTIQNIIVCDNYTVANDLARLSYGEEAYAVDTTLYPVTFGDTHIDGTFYHNGEVVLPTKTDSEKLSELEGFTSAINLRQAEAEADTDFRLSMLELGSI